MEVQKAVGELKQKKEMYLWNYRLFEEYMHDIFVKYEFELTVYDEVEVFRDWDDALFNYPYGRRKQVLRQMSIVPEGEALSL